MSYDFELFVASAASLPSPPDTSAGIINMDSPDRVKSEDIPESFLPFVGKKRWLYRIHLEGAFGAEDRAAIDYWLREIVTASKGMLIDMQTCTFETVSKSGSIEIAKSMPISLGSMSFYFEDGEAFYERGFEAMFKAIKEIYPAALPTRYGHYEPLQGRVIAGDFAEIVSAFRMDPHLLIKSPAPFGHISLSVPCNKTFESYPPDHFIRRHHLLGHVEFELRPAIFSSPAKRSALLQLFKKLCAEMRIVYAEILETEAGSGGWLWYGLPDQPQTYAICIGPAYQSVWPDASHGGEVVGDRLRVFVVDRFGNPPPRPPSDLIAPDRSTLDLQGKPVCARIFPFEYEFDYEKYNF
jgi:hypothetical protein